MYNVATLLKDRVEITQLKCVELQLHIPFMSYPERGMNLTFAQKDDQLHCNVWQISSSLDFAFLELCNKKQCKSDQSF